jgi:hypothetical protein
MTTPYTLTIYIDPLLLQTAGKLANLTFARKVNGKANVIFQSATPDDLNAQNDFGWTQSYKMAAVTKFLDSTLLDGFTTKQPIKPGQACYWTSTMRDMPLASSAPASFDKGSFGTVGLPDNRYHNCIFGQIGSGGFNCIFVDDDSVTGLTNRGYIVDNDYQVSWEEHSFGVGIYRKAWSDPWPFSIAPTVNSQYLSWGYAKPNGLGEPAWYNYGTKDPGAHDPSQALPQVHPHVLGAIDNVSFRLSWDGAKVLSDDGRREYAFKVAAYLRESSKGCLNLSIEELSTDILARASLNAGSGFGDILVGSTREEKVRAVLRTLLQNIAPRYWPLEQDWDFRPIGNNAPQYGDDISLPKSDLEFEGLAEVLVKLGWAVGTAGIALAAKYLRGLIADSTKATVTVSQPIRSPDGTVMTATYSFSSTQANLIPNLTAIGNIVAAEARRQHPPLMGKGSNASETPPTPDPVFLFSEEIDFLRVKFTDSRGFEVIKTAQPGMAEYKALFGKRYATKRIDGANGANSSA